MLDMLKSEAAKLEAVIAAKEKELALLKKQLRIAATSIKQLAELIAAPEAAEEECPDGSQD